MFQDEELVHEFVVESAAHLAQVEGKLLEIDPAGENYDSCLVNTIFRAVHSVKGADGFHSLTVINSLAHSLENVSNMIRNRELSLNKPIVNILLRSADQLRCLDDHVETSNEVDVSELVFQLAAIYSGESLESAPESDLDSQIDQLLQIADTNVQAADARTISTAQEDDAAHLLSQKASSFASPPEVIAKEPTASPPSSSKNPTSKTMKMAPARNAEAAPVNRNNNATDSIIRVNVAVLDRLMNLAGELVLSRNQLILALSNGNREGLQSIASRVDQLTSELQESILQTRMQQIGTVFGRFPRVVSDLSNKLGKECVLDIEGDEVAVDTTIVEAMREPLTHLVCNSVDHGIETPDKRKASGKSAVGRVRLRAFHQAGKVCIRIEDDGAGMDPVRLKTKAIEKGIITVDQAASMSDNEALRLIFAPGFSFAHHVTDVSGPGIGMDIVKTKIEHLGGTVDLESMLGRGSAVHITLPLFFAMVPSMIVDGSGERYAVPQANTVEMVRGPESENVASSGSILGEELHRLLLFTTHTCEQFAVQMAMVARIERIKASEIRTVGSQNILTYRGQSLPILRLEQNIAALPPEFEPENLFVIVFRAGDRELGLVAPTLKDIRDVKMVIDAKRLREPGVLGAVIVEKTTIRVLDLQELVRLKYADWFQEENAVRSEKAVETTTIVLAEDSKFFRNHMTRTLESEEFKVIGEVDGLVACDHLQAIFDEIDVIVTDIEMPHMSSRPYRIARGRSINPIHRNFS